MGGITGATQLHIRTTFKQQYPNFQGTVGGLGGEDDNYSSINFSAFAEQWNDHVASLGTTKPSFTYKTASHLQEAFKQMGITSRRTTTLLPHNERISNLRDQHTGGEGNRSYTHSFASAESPSRVTLKTFDSKSTQTATTVQLLIATAHEDDTSDEEYGSGGAHIDGSLRYPAEIARMRDKGRVINKRH